MFQSAESHKEPQSKSDLSAIIQNNLQWDLRWRREIQMPNYYQQSMWILQKIDNRSPHPLYAVETCYLSLQLYDLSASLVAVIMIIK